MRLEAEQDESALVCAAQRGEKEAFRLLLTRNWAWLKNMVYSIVTDSNDVDDVLQDVCVRVIRKIDTLRQPERFRPWLAVLARRQAIRHCQRRKTRPTLLDETIIDQHCDDKADKFPENIERVEQYRQILQAMNSLPEKYREVIMLASSGDLTYGANL